MKHRIEIANKLFIAKSHDQESERLNISGTLFIIFLVPIVLPAIELDDEVLVDAHEIDGVNQNRNLSPKFQPFESAPTQDTPQAVLRPGLVATKCPGKFSMLCCQLCGPS